MFHKSLGYRDEASNFRDSEYGASRPIPDTREIQSVPEGLCPPDD
jgi:hypothetical protein